jgi:hypothetical protein
MKTFFRYSGAVLLMAFCVIHLISSGCKKKSTDDNNNSGNCACWNESWLLGTWEGTTPSSIQPFAGTKIRIAFLSVQLKQHDTIAGNIRKTWAYTGTVTWDPDNTPWVMGFDPTHFPLHNTILFECLSYCAIGQSVDNVSIRVADTVQLNVMHTIDLDWGPSASGTGVAPGYIDLFGDIEIDNNGAISRADYPPDAGSMIRLTKK